MKLKRSHLAILLVIGLLVLDQAVKIWVKTHMSLNEAIPVFGRWFYLRFIENPGAAYGMELGGTYGKLLLTLFRIALVGAIIWWIRRLIRKGASTGIVVGLSLVLAGALGNILDSVFYGMIFSESTFTEVAHWTAWGEGYGTFLHGNVVDMLYFPLIEVEQMPDWFPFVGGEPYTFFSPIFNIADSYVFCGLLYLVIFQHRFFK